MNESPTANRDQADPRASNKKNARDNLTHAGEFTKIENTAIVYVLRGWFGALIRPENATEIIQASDDVWAKQTLFEHFDSELKFRSGNTNARKQSRPSGTQSTSRSRAGTVEPNSRRRHRRGRTN